MQTKKRSGSGCKWLAFSHIVCKWQTWDLKGQRKSRNSVLNHCAVLPLYSNPYVENPVSLELLVTDTQFFGFFFSQFWLNHTRKHCPGMRPRSHRAQVLTLRVWEKTWTYQGHSASGHCWFPLLSPDCSQEAASALPGQMPPGGPPIAPWAYGHFVFSTPNSVYWFLSLSSSLICGHFCNLHAQYNAWSMEFSRNLCWTFSSSILNQTLHHRHYFLSIQFFTPFYTQIIPILDRKL